jgi:hypothetical protein
MSRKIVVKLFTSRGHGRCKGIVDFTSSIYCCTRDARLRINCCVKDQILKNVVQALEAISKPEDLMGKLA